MGTTFLKPLIFPKQKIESALVNFFCSSISELFCQNIGLFEKQIFLKKIIQIFVAISLLYRVKQEYFEKINCGVFVAHSFEIFPFLEYVKWTNIWLPLKNAFLLLIYHQWLLHKFIFQKKCADFIRILLVRVYNILNRLHSEHSMFS